MNQLQWARRAPNSDNNFDLILTNPQDLDGKHLLEKLEAVKREEHRALTLSGRATKEWERFLHNPTTALQSEAYVLLSNWFLTSSGDRNSMVATRCEEFWDALFPVRPAERLSSPKPGRNHAMTRKDFESFWNLVLKAQGHPSREVKGTFSTGRATYMLSPPTDEDAIPKEDEDIRKIDHPQPAASERNGLTLVEAKRGLALSFGVSPDQIEITIRG